MKAPESFVSNLKTQPCDNSRPCMGSKRFFKAIHTKLSQLPAPKQLLLKHRDGNKNQTNKQIKRKQPTTSQNVCVYIYKWGGKGRKK